MTAPVADQTARVRNVVVTVLTGFLGSGKTTLLNRLLAHPSMAEAAVIVNEIGEIGIDDALIARASADAVLLNSGCVCCTIKDDLTATLQEMVFQVLRGELPAFRRVVIETTGLADPGPILQILMQDPMLGAYYRVGGVLTTVDAVNGAPTLDEHAEAVHQAAVADRLLLTKIDLVDPAALAALRAQLHDLNPAAKVFPVVNGEIDPALLFDTALFDPLTRTIDVQRWLNLDGFGDGDRAHDHDHEHRHHGIRSSAVIVEEPVSARSFQRWIEAMTSRSGRDLLRIKGIVNVREQPQTPWVVHGVQDVFHPPVMLDHWPTPDRRTRIVFVTRGDGQESVAETLRLFGQGAHAMRARALSADKN